MSDPNVVSTWLPELRKQAPAYALAVAIGWWLGTIILRQHADYQKAISAAGTKTEKLLREMIAMKDAGTARSIESDAASERLRQACERLERLIEALEKKGGMS